MAGSDGQAVAPEEETSQTSEDSAVESDEPPEMGADEMADFSAVAEEVAEETTETDPDDQPDDQPEAGDGADSGTTDETSQTTSEIPADSDLSLGDLYCNGLGLAAALARTEHGTADPAERDDLADQYADMARQIEIDRYLDQHLADSRHLDSLSPGQAVVIGSLMFGGMVLMDDPDMAAGIAEGVRSG